MRAFIIMILLCFTAAVVIAGDTEANYAKCTVTVKWSRRGEDASVTVSVKNGAKKTLVDPVVRVTFFDKDGNKVASDSKAYFARIGKGANKRMETRIWSLIPPEAEKAEGKVEGGYFE